MIILNKNKYKALADIIREKTSSSEILKPHDLSLKLDELQTVNPDSLIVSASKNDNSDLVTWIDLQTLKNNSYYNNSHIKHVICSDNLQTVGVFAFSGSTIESIKCGSSVLFGSGVFQNTQHLKSVDLTATTSDCFQSTGIFENSALEEISLPTNITKIPSKTFYICKNLTQIDLSSTAVKTIESTAFYSCSSLQTVLLPDTLTSIAIHAFNSCGSLTNINIPSSVLSIGEKSFSLCVALSKIFIPSSVTKITAPSATQGPFYLCSENLEIYTDADAAADGWGKCWDYIDNNKKITVHYGVSYDEFKLIKGD